MDLNWIKSWVKENGYEIDIRGDNPQIVIVGEIHGLFVKQQEELVDKLRPEYLLHELIGIQTYDPRTQRKGELEGRLIDGVCEMHGMSGHTIQWSDEYGIYLVGCDLSLSELDVVERELVEKRPNIYRYGPAGLVERLDGTPFFITQDDGVVEYKDIHMGEMIVEYAAKTEKPLVTIVGSSHMRPESQIHQILQDANIEYAYVDMTTLEGTIRSRFHQSEIYQPEEDKVRIGIVDDPGKFPSKVSVGYCKSLLSEYDFTDLDQEDVTDENDELLYTGFGLDFHPYVKKVTGQLNVHPDYRGRGIGRDLVMLMEEIARTIGIDEIRMEDSNKEFFSHFIGYELQGDYMVKSL